MKNVKNFRILILLFLGLLTIQSCEKDFVSDGPETFVDSGSESGDDDFDDEDDDLGSDSTNGDNSEDDFDSESEGGDGEITVYTVNGSDIVKEKDFQVSGKALDFQKDVAKHQEIWELTKKIIPANYLTKMSRFMIFAGEDNGTAGYVYNTKADLSKWEMGIAIDFAYEGGFNADGELAYTIIHEFGHILTLEIAQVDASVSANNCTNYFTGEGCARKDAYINKLQTRFWADIADEHEKIDENQDEQEAFYNKYQDRFVTNYASTNPGEDIAEVFATFVTRNGGVNGVAIAEQKIQLMYDHPELVGLRDFIRGNMTSAKGKRALPVAGSWKQAKKYGNSKKSHCTKHSK